MEVIMQHVLDRLLTKIQEAGIDTLPSDNIYMEDVFDPKIYAEILKRLPEDEAYQFIEHPDAILPDGRKTRKLLDLTTDKIDSFAVADQEFWQQMQAIMTADTLLNALVKKFEARIRLRFGKNIPEMFLVPIFYRDYPGYYITEHTDAPYKIATMQFYFARDNSQLHLGTSFHLKKPKGFQLLKTNLFQPNSAYAFARTDESWHSVKQLAPHEKIRDTLALTVYVKGQEYQSKNYL
jgi:hypothetical protein